MEMSNTIEVRLNSVTTEALGIVSYELVPVNAGDELPAFAAGAHVDVQLPGGMVRSTVLLVAVIWEMAEPMSAPC